MHWWVIMYNQTDIRGQSWAVRDLSRKSFANQRCCCWHFSGFILKPFFSCLFLKGELIRRSTLIIRSFLLGPCPHVLWCNPDGQLEGDIGSEDKAEENMKVRLESCSKSWTGMSHCQESLTENIVVLGFFAFRDADRSLSDYIKNKSPWINRCNKLQYQKRQILETSSNQIQFGQTILGQIGIFDNSSINLYFAFNWQIDEVCWTVCSSWTRMRQPFSVKSSSLHTLEIKVPLFQMKDIHCVSVSLVCTHVKIGNDPIR